MPTVYVADRDAAHRRELTQAFRRRGFRAFEFANGSDLYASVIAGAPDLVTLDVDLDEMDGFQVFARLLRKRDSRPLPLVFVSDFQNAHVVETCIQRGALGYLRKGDMADLVAAAAEDLLGDVSDDSAEAKLAAAPDDAPDTRETRAGADDSSPSKESAGVTVPSGPLPAGSSGKTADAGARPREAARGAKPRKPAREAAAPAPKAAPAPQPRKAAKETAAPAPRAARDTAAPTPKAASGTRRARWKRWAMFVACMLVAALGFALGALIISRLPGPGTAVPREPARPPAPATGAVVDASDAKSAPAFPASSPLPEPVATTLAGLGLELPPGSALDRAGSDVRPLAERGAPAGARAPRMLTFRTDRTVNEVLELYTRAGLAFDRQVVRMDGRYRGIERTVARARISQDGREATLTVTHPGIDLTEESLVQATSLRIDVRE
jgi:CheY-like chemotaxis protein